MRTLGCGIANTAERLFATSADAKEYWPFLLCQVRYRTEPLQNRFGAGAIPLPLAVCRMLIGNGLVRSGSYGDPAAVPVSVWIELQLNIESGQLTLTNGDVSRTRIVLWQALTPL